VSDSTPKAASSTHRAGQYIKLTIMRDPASSNRIAKWCNVSTLAPF
jgi:hypothetical protein